MKLNIKSSFAAIAVIASVFLVSCSVEYRARHPRHRHNKKVVIVGMEKSNIPADSVGAALTGNPPVGDTASTKAIKQK